MYLPLLAAIGPVAGVPAVLLIMGTLIGLELAFGGGSSVMSFVHGVVGWQRHDPQAQAQMVASGKTLAVLAVIAIGGGLLGQWGIGATF